MTAGLSLYEMLTGHIGDAPVGTHDEKTQEILSVLENLRRILNTRAGSLKHLPDYGLPDLTNIYKTLPASAHLLKAQMESTLLTYEPRLKSVTVEVSNEPDQDMAIAYFLTCHLRKAGLVRFGTHFSSEGITLRHWPNQG